MDISAYMAYPVRFMPSDEGGFTVVVSGVDGAISEGRSREEAEVAAVEVIADMAAYYLDEKCPIPPPPQAKDGEELVRIPIVMALKIVLRNEMLSQNVTQKELSRRLGVSAQSLWQTLDLSRTRTSIDALYDAFCALGKKLVFSVA